MPQMLYLIQTGHNLPDGHDLKNVHCWSSLIDLLHCHDVLTNTCTCQPQSTKIWRCLEVFAFATCTSPITHLICPPKFCIAFVFHFSWVLKLSQEELKTMLMQNFGEQNLLPKKWGALSFSTMSEYSLKITQRLSECFRCR